MFLKYKAYNLRGDGLVVTADYEVSNWNPATNINLCWLVIEI